MNRSLTITLRMMGRIKCIPIPNFKHGEFLAITMEASNLFSQSIFTTRTSGEYWTPLTTRVDIFLLLLGQDVSTFLSIRHY